MSGLDKLMHVRRPADGQTPPDCLGRFLCTKSSWRGSYRRIVGLTPTAVFTQHPESLSVTNSWSFVGDPDIDGVAVSSSDPEEFTISARQDGKSRYKPSKFSCCQRAALLTLLYQGMAEAAAHRNCSIAAKVMG
eukprot:jgi/Astpho2/3749/Aster-x0176